MNPESAPAPEPAAPNTPAPAKTVASRSARRILLRLALMALATVLALLAVEAYLRATGFAIDYYLKTGPDLPDGPSLELLGDEQQKSKFLRDQFPLPVHTSSETSRVFFFGGSSTQGFPFSQHSFPATFEAALHSADSAGVQAVNLGALQFAIRDERLLLEELLRHGVRPDAIVVHSGNNELYYHRARAIDEFRRPVRRALRAMERSRLAQLIESRLPGPTVPRLPYPLHLRYPLTEENIRLVAQAFELDLLHMVHDCRERGIPVVLTTAPINRDYWSPVFCPYGAGTPGETRELEHVAEEGERQYQDGDMEKAAACFQRVLAKSPEEPKSNFYFGRILLKEGQKDEARRRLELAIRRDILSLRAIPDFNDRVRGIATRYRGQGVYLIDFDQHFLNKHGMDGKKIFIDNCHGKLETYLEMGVLTARFFAGERILQNLLAEISLEVALQRLRGQARISDQDLTRVRAFVDSCQEQGTPFVQEWHKNFESYEAELRAQGVLD